VLYCNIVYYVGIALCNWITERRLSLDVKTERARRGRRCEDNTEKDFKEIIVRLWTGRNYLRLEPRGSFC